VVDIVGYRRNGHNELDDPRVTLPLSYQLIQQHPTVLEIYAKKLMVRRAGNRAAAADEASAADCPASAL
jgi:2-oxoglutarate dehydrogenase E1 component